jgi:uncharacterized protein
MSRLIFIVAVIGLVYWLLKSYRKSASQDEPSNATEDMVRCMKCGIHIPKSESLQKDGKYFCCEDHRRSFN